MNNQKINPLDEIREIEVSDFIAILNSHLGTSSELFAMEFFSNLYESPVKRFYYSDKSLLHGLYLAFVVCLNHLSDNQFDRMFTNIANDLGVNKQYLKMFLNQKAFL